MKSFLYISIVLLVVTCLLACSPKINLSDTTVPSEQINYLQSEEVQLNEPAFKTSAVLFDNAHSIELEFAQENTQIEYQVNDGPLLNYSDVITIDRNSTIRAKSTSLHFKDSAWNEKTYIKRNQKLSKASILLSENPNEKYAGNGISSLLDHQLGTLNFTQNNSWLGFQKDTLDVKLKFAQSTAISSILVSTLIDQNAWIFSPKEIQVWSDSEMMGVNRYEDADLQSNKCLKMRTVNIKKTNLEALTLKIISCETLPDWHTGKGHSPWLFIDEIFVD